MSRDRPEPVPYFGCQPFVPAPPLKPGAKPGRCGLCRSKNGLAPDGSPYVCMRCYSVSPENDAALSGKRTEAIRTQELERREVANAAAELRASRKSSKTRSDLTLTLAEREQLVADYPGATDLVLAWLESIGQPLPVAVDAKPGPKMSPKRKRSEQRRLDREKSTKARRTA